MLSGELKSIELFAGAGGLALGTGLAGFHAAAAIERDRWACETLEENRARGYPLVKDLRVVCGDVRNIDYSAIPDDLDLVSGGPPCQPFSIGGKGRAYNDDRDMFSAFADVVARTKPRSFIIENVKGLTRSSLANYLSYIELRMSMPEVSSITASGAGRSCASARPVSRASRSRTSASTAAKSRPDAAPPSSSQRLRARTSALAVT